MISESARATSAAEARFRVQAPNSRPRALTVVALDRSAETIVRRLAGANWRHTTFVLAASGTDALTDLHGGPLSAEEMVQHADLVVLVAGPGGRAQAASMVGEACSRRRVMTTGCFVGAASAPEPELSKTLAQLRPWSLMLVIARSDDYVDDMMTALRA
jgi:hypothetical protein